VPKHGLWPGDLKASTDPMPADTLQVQAQELQKATDGKLVGRVEVGSIGDKISLNFVIVAPSLNNYQYRLLKVLHGVNSPYPLHIVLNMNESREAGDQREFEAQLAQIFQAASTRTVLGELLALSEKAEEKKVKRKF
jgi:hypothetical protein